MVQLTTPQPARHPDPTVKAQRLAHIIFERPDLDKAESFLLDFGLVLGERTDDALYMRGAAKAPYCYVVRKGNPGSKKARFIGFGLEAGSREELERLTHVPGASAIEPLNTPGGGEVVRLTDPCGNLVEAVFGQTPYEALSVREPLNLNALEPQVRVNETQRPPVAPPQIIKLGHLVLEAPKYQETMAWYTKHFGLIPSDVQVLPDGVPIVTFFRFDCGDKPADHHCIAMGQGLWAGLDHSAYEVVDQDAVAMGQRVLREKGYKHAWGIGRHLLGSQIFDYWRDSWGVKHEHYCDGDVFTADVPTDVSYASKHGLSQWGPPVPSGFLKPKLNFSRFMALLRNLKTSPDLSVGKLITIARVML